MGYIRLREPAKYHGGEPRPEGYMDFIEWAKAQRKAGYRQTRCRQCGRFSFPQELTGRICNECLCPATGRPDSPSGTGG